MLTEAEERAYQLLARNQKRWKYLRVIGLLVGAVDDAHVGMAVDVVALEPYAGSRTFAFRL